MAFSMGLTADNGVYRLLPKTAFSPYSTGLLPKSCRPPVHTIRIGVVLASGVNPDTSRSRRLTESKRSAQAELRESEGSDRASFCD